jgi:hypothetical protein
MDAGAWDWSRPVVDHVDLRVGDFGTSVRFYEIALAPLGSRSSSSGMVKRASRT